MDGSDTDDGTGDIGPLTGRTVGAISELAKADWDRCAGADNPFVSYDFLHALEASGSVGPNTGWAPMHVVLETEAGDLIGAMPLYLKTHSQGEYVFDYAWADAYERAGGRYYPKLQCSVPFTPATGPRLLTDPAYPTDRVRRFLLGAAVQFAERCEVSSLHITYPTGEEWEVMGSAGFLQRTGEQFHWENRGYETFDDFLADLNARKRKAIRKERARAVANDITIDVLSGDALRTEHWDAFFEFYIDTGSRKWGSPYLTESFFHRIHETMADRIALVMCSRAGRYVAGALNLFGTDTLFGRNWGCIEHHDCLHFETCYYQAIEFAITRGMQRVEAGAQGPHKIQRGYMPVHTYSAHWLRDAGFRRAVDDYLKGERKHIDYEVAAIKENYSPFRKTGPGRQSTGSG